MIQISFWSSSNPRQNDDLDEDRHTGLGFRDDLCDNSHLWRPPSQSTHRYSMAGTISLTQSKWLCIYHHYGLQCCNFSWHWSLPWCLQCPRSYYSTSTLSQFHNAWSEPFQDLCNSPSHATSHSPLKFSYLVFTLKRKKDAMAAAWVLEETRQITDRWWSRSLTGDGQVMDRWWTVRSEKTCGKHLYLDFEADRGGGRPLSDKNLKEGTTWQLLTASAENDPIW